MTEPALLTAEQLTIEIARELYDRFVMGGWEPQDAYPQIGRWINEYDAALRDERDQLQQRLSEFKRDFPLVAEQRNQMQQELDIARKSCGFCHQLQGHAADCWTVKIVAERDRLRKELTELLFACDNERQITVFGGLLIRKMNEARAALAQSAETSKGTVRM